MVHDRIQDFRHFFIGQSSLGLLSLRFGFGLSLYPCFLLCGSYFNLLTIINDDRLVLLLYLQRNNYYNKDCEMLNLFENTFAVFVLVRRIPLLEFT